MINDNKTRCGWCLSSEIYQNYHDYEWGIPVFDDKVLFEFLILETFQAGLSWITILNKRKNFESAFDSFDVQTIANYNELKIQELLLNSGIIRNKLKIRSAVINANLFIMIQKEYGSFSNYIWKFVDYKSIINRPKTLKDVPATTPISNAISKDLKKRGFKFVGSTVVYAYMQAVGIVNDHVESCDFK